MSIANLSNELKNIILDNSTILNGRITQYLGDRYEVVLENNSRVLAINLSDSNQRGSFVTVAKSDLNEYYILPGDSGTKFSYESSSLNGSDLRKSKKKEPNMLSLMKKSINEYPYSLMRYRKTDPNSGEGKEEWYILASKDKQFAGNSYYKIFDYTLRNSEFYFQAGIGGVFGDPGWATSPNNLYKLNGVWDLDGINPSPTNGKGLVYGYYEVTEETELVFNLTGDITLQEVYGGTSAGYCNFQIAIYNSNGLIQFSLALDPTGNPITFYHEVYVTNEDEFGVGIPDENGNYPPLPVPITRSVNQTFNITLPPGIYGMYSVIEALRGPNCRFIANLSMERVFNKPVYPITRRATISATDNKIFVHHLGQKRVFSFSSMNVADDSEWGYLRYFVFNNSILQSQNLQVFNGVDLTPSEFTSDPEDWRGALVSYAPFGIVESNPCNMNYLLASGTNLINNQALNVDLMQLVPNYFGDPTPLKDALLDYVPVRTVELQSRSAIPSGITCVLGSNSITSTKILGFPLSNINAVVFGIAPKKV